MILLADNDVLITLAQCDLINEALNVFQCGFSDCFVVSAAPHSLYLNDPQKCFDRRLGNHEAFGRLSGLVQSCKTLGAAEENLDLLEALSQIDGVDDGELELFLHADNLCRAGYPYVLSTGDKRALKALLASNCQLAFPSLHQKIECLESLLIKAITIYGHTHITKKIGYGHSTTTDPTKFDKVLRIAFGNGRDPNHTSLTLNHYMQDIIYFIRP